MKVIPASSSKYNQSYGKSNLSLPQANVNNTGLKSDVAFGSTAGVLKDKSTGIFKWIDSKGFFVEFLIVDAVSLIAPRVWIGLNRDKEKLGHYNYQAGAEEAGREMTSGPSMNIIPMMILAIVSKLKPASHIDKDALQCLTHNMKDVIRNSEGNMDSKTLHKKFADKLFDDAFGDFDLDKKGDFKTKFSELLVNTEDLKPRSTLGRLIDKLKGVKSNAYDQAVDEFEKLVISINNKNKKERTDNPKNITIKGQNGISYSDGAAEFIHDFKDYSQDIISKFNHQNVPKHESEKFFESITKRRVNIKYATAVAAFFAVGSFLLYLPKLYQRGKVSPAGQSAMFAEGGCNENK